MLIIPTLHAHMLIVPTLPKLVLHYVNLLCQADMIGRFSKLSWSGTVSAASLIGMVFFVATF
jgi:hypothetical protein